MSFRIGFSDCGNVDFNFRSEGDKNAEPFIGAVTR